MTEPISLALTLDISVQDPSLVIDAAARELVSRRHAETVEEARTILHGNVGKAIAMLIDLHDLTSAGAVVLQIQSATSEPILSQSGLPLPTVLTQPTL